MMGGVDTGAAWEGTAVLARLVVRLGAATDGLDDTGWGSCARRTMSRTAGRERAATARHVTETRVISRRTHSPVEETTRTAVGTAAVGDEFSGHGPQLVRLRCPAGLRISKALAKPLTS